MRVIGNAGTLDTVRDDQTLREVGTVRVVGNAGTLGTVRDDQTLGEIGTVRVVGMQELQAP